MLMKAACRYLQIDLEGKVQFLGPLFTSYSTFSKFFNISVPQFFHLPNMDNTSV